MTTHTFHRTGLLLILVTAVVAAVMSTYAVSGFYAIAVDEHMAPGRPDLAPASRQ